MAITSHSHYPTAGAIISENVELYVNNTSRGRIHLLMHPVLETDDVDRILIEYQQQAASGDLKFRRWPLRSVRSILVFVHHCTN